MILPWASSAMTPSSRLARICSQEICGGERRLDRVGAFMIKVVMKAE
jgi:hypothetical protein